MSRATSPARLSLRAAGPAPSNVDVAIEALRDAIIEGRLKPGERLKEIPLAKELGVSRGPIRDALRLLERDGLVEVQPNRGAIVPEVRAADILEVYALRGALGALALRKMMLDGSVLEKALEKHLGRLRAAVKRGDAKTATGACLDFQSAVVSAAGMPRVEREFERLTWQAQIFLASLDIAYEDKLERMGAEVEELHAAICTGRAGNAEKVWITKLDRWVQDLVALLPEPYDEGSWAALTSGRK